MGYNAVWSVVYQKIGVFITTAVRTPNPIFRFFVDNARVLPCLHVYVKIMDGLYPILRSPTK